MPEFTLQIPHLLNYSIAVFTLIGIMIKTTKTFK